MNARTLALFLAVAALALAGCDDERECVRDHIEFITVLTPHVHLVPITKCDEYAPEAPR